jgi:hypothetical protein
MLHFKPGFKFGSSSKMLSVIRLFTLRNLASVCLFVTTLLPSALYAEAGRTDYDVDADGLIEINSLADFFAIQDTFGAAQLYGESTGCPDQGCSGFELMADLDFASTPSTQSWPAAYLYQSVFEGNYHTIKNITASSFKGGDGGLFRTLDKSTLRNLNIENVNFNQTADTYLGTIAATALNSFLINVRVTGGSLRATHYTGGLVAVANATTFLGCHFSGTIKPNFMGGGLGKGGLIGDAENSMIYASSAEGKFETNQVLTPNHELGGIIGSTHSSNTIIASFARFNSSTVNLIGNIAASAVGNVTESSYAVFQESENLLQNAVAITFYSRPSQAAAQSYIKTITPDELKCPQSEWDKRCSQPGLFDRWQTHEDSIGQKVWEFGSNTEFPKIRADLIFDMTDSDKDGVVDVVDRFAQHNAASIDSDRDNLPDYWAASCDRQCQLASGLQLDSRIEYTASNSDTNAPKAGAVSLINLLLTFFILGISLRVRKFQNTSKFH